MISGSADWNPSWLIIQILNGICLMAIKACLSVCMAVCAYADGSLIWFLDSPFFLDSLKCNFKYNFDIYELQCWWMYI